MQPPVPDQAPVPVGPPAISLDELARRIDVIGHQMNWLCDNMQSLFAFVQQMGSNGGGLRGLMSMLKQGAPALTVTESPIDNESKVGS